MLSRRRVPADLVVQLGDLRLTSPALTALDLLGRRGGDGIDRALRTESTALPLLCSAFDANPGRPGDVDRRRLLLDSRDEPWSAAERRCHRLLRAARVGGWRANHPVLLRGRLRNEGGYSTAPANWAS